MGYSYVYPPLSKNSDRLDAHSGFTKHKYKRKYKYKYKYKYK